MYRRTLGRLTATGDGPGVPIRTERTVRVEAPPDEVWAVLHRVGDYPSWWRWLRRFDARALAVGERWRCTIRPPLPWTLQVDVLLVAVADGRVDAAVSGDVTGVASVTVEADPAGGSRILLDATLDAVGGATALLHRVAPGASRWAHDRVVDAAVTGFRRRAL